MKKTLLSALLLSSTMVLAQPTIRLNQFTNDQVNVWKTIISADKNQPLKMHRHDHDRVVIALTDGLLKVTNDKHQVHFLKLVKNHSYFLHKDVPNELHQDENVGKTPVEVIVVELTH